jgi:hypothetical protein
LRIRRVELDYRVFARINWLVPFVEKFNRASVGRDAGIADRVIRAPSENPLQGTTSGNPTQASVTNKSEELPPIHSTV